MNASINIIIIRIINNNNNPNNHNNNNNNNNNNIKKIYIYCYLFLNATNEEGDWPGLGQAAAAAAPGWESAEPGAASWTPWRVSTNSTWWSAGMTATHTNTARTHTAIRTRPTSLVEAEHHGRSAHNTQPRIVLHAQRCQRCFLRVSDIGLSVFFFFFLFFFNIFYLFFMVIIYIIMSMIIMFIILVFCFDF